MCQLHGNFSCRRLHLHQRDIGDCPRHTRVTRLGPGTRGFILDDHKLPNLTAVDAIYSDFEKAFDKVPHKRLISKLHSYSIDEGIIKWIVDFLEARKYRVRVNGSYSGYLSIYLKSRD